MIHGEKMPEISVSIPLMMADVSNIEGHTTTWTTAKSSGYFMNKHNHYKFF